MFLKQNVIAHDIDKIGNDKFCGDKVHGDTTKYLKNALNPRIEQLTVNVVLEGKQLSLELEIGGEAGEGDAGAGVAVPPDEGVVGRRLAAHVAEDVVHHLGPGLGLHLDLALLPGAPRGGGGQRGQPLALPAHADLVVGRTEGGGDLGLPRVVVDAAHTSHHLAPDVGAVGGQEAPHQTEVLGTLEQEDETVVETRATAATSEFLIQKDDKFLLVKLKV